MLTAEILAALERRFPPTLAEDWDNVGFLLGHRGREVDTLMTCLTLTPDVAAEAVERGVDLIVTHHPILFSGTKRLTGDAPDSAALLALIAAGCGVYSPHTAFDSATEGINAWLIRSLGVSEAIPITPSPGDPAAGTGRIGQLDKPCSLADLADRLCRATGIAGTHRVGEPDREIGVVAVACGAAGSLLDDALRAGADAFVTGELRFHDALTARSSGVAVLVPGHYATERPAVEWLAGELDAELDGVACFASERERDPLRWHAVGA